EMIIRAAFRSCQSRLGATASRRGPHTQPVLRHPNRCESSWRRRFLGVFICALGMPSIAPAQTITEFPVPIGGNPNYIVSGPDDNLWFAVGIGGLIGRITTAGVISEFPVPTASSYPQDIAAGPDGNLWFTEQGIGKIGRITTAGVITEFDLPTAGP